MFTIYIENGHSRFTDNFMAVTSTLYYKGFEPVIEYKTREYISNLAGRDTDLVVLGAGVSVLHDVFDLVNFIESSK